MKAIKVNIILSFLVVSIQLLGQSNRALIKEYRSAKEKAAKVTEFNMDNRAELYQSMDLIPRIVWGKMKAKLLYKKQFYLSNEPYFMVFYDFDNDEIADQFVIETLKGKELTSEFGFLYDINNDGKIDYIVFNGGFMAGKNNDFYYFFYHWIDTDFDGKIDALVYNIVVYPNDTLPDSNKIIWVMDRDKNGKPDSVDCIDIQKKQVNPLIASDGIWNYNTIFGAKKVDSNDSNYFKIYNEYLTAINQFFKAN